MLEVLDGAAVVEVVDGAVVVEVVDGAVEVEVVDGAVVVELVEVLEPLPLPEPELGEPCGQGLHFLSWLVIEW